MKAHPYLKSGRQIKILKKAPSRWELRIAARRVV